MLPNWLSSWYQQAQSQEPFNDNYKAAGDEEGDWVEVITPSVRNTSTNRRQPTVQPQPKTSEHHNTAVIAQAEVNNDMIIDNESFSSASITAIPSTPVTTTEPAVKGLSRQERRANARFAVKEKRKQARNAAMVMNRSRIGMACLPSSPISIDH